MPAGTVSAFGVIEIEVAGVHRVRSAETTTFPRGRRVVACILSAHRCDSAMRQHPRTTAPTQFRTLINQTPDDVRRKSAALGYKAGCARRSPPVLVRLAPASHLAE
jgi:hypothetical protein